MNNAEKRLVEALRSGEYNQCQQFLRVTEGFCCLGVACDISRLGYWKQNSKVAMYSYGSVEDFGMDDDSAQSLSESVRRELNWRYSTGVTWIKNRENIHVSLVELNDSDFTFNQIADIIEANLMMHNGDLEEY